jgi:hypothetical protein
MYNEMKANYEKELRKLIERNAPPSNYQQRIKDEYQCILKYGPKGKLC